MRFGELLRQERERRAVTLDGISAITRVSLRHLRALEADHFQDLPGGVFSTGIVRSYARCCELNEEETLQQFQQAAQRAGIRTEADPMNLAAFAENVKRSRTPRQTVRRFDRLGVAAMLVAVLVLAVLTAVVLHRRGTLGVPHRQQEAQSRLRPSPGL